VTKLYTGQVIPAIEISGAPRALSPRFPGAKYSSGQAPSLPTGRQAQPKRLAVHFAMLECPSAKCPELAEGLWPRMYKNGKK